MYGQRWQNDFTKYIFTRFLAKLIEKEETIFCNNITKAYT